MRWPGSSAKPAAFATAALAAHAADLARGPVAILLVEDAVEVDSTIAHLLRLGFRDVVVLAPDGLELAPDHAARVHLVRHSVHARDALVTAVNAMIDPLAGAWLHACHNAEYLFFPFCETRRVRELVTFHAEERRAAMLTTVIDLYAGDLQVHPGGVARTDAWLDRSGYYATPRKDPASDWAEMERQVDIFGGLRRRYEEHVPWDRRRIDRISLFRAEKGVRLRPDFTLTKPELNTHACVWHHNLTAAVCSFRAAKALCANPGSRPAITGFRWPGSEPFRWHSQQLLDLGMIEPGQWV